jgi:dCTP deaminase
MADQAEKLFAAEGAESAELHATGILPSQAIRAFCRDKVIQSIEEITEAQIQPSSIDLRLGDRAYRVRASFLPGRDVKVADKIDSLGMHEIDLAGGAVLEKGCVYIVPCLESVRLQQRLSGVANPKSSSGRLDIFCRLITDGGVEFDRVRAAYKGPLYTEISPQTFSVVVHKGISLNQLRLRRGSPQASDTQLRRLHETTPLVDSENGEALIERGLAVSVDLKGAGEDSLIGYRAKRHTDLIDLAKVGHYDHREFWEPVYAEAGGRLLLNPGDFYILMSREAVTVPPDHAAEMTAYDTLVGEFRVHYAGFFDPGFGYAGSGGAGSRAVLEVRSHEVPFMLEHGQTVGRLVYERLTAIPDKIYGTGIGSNYQRQTLQLAKQFKKPGPRG